MLTLIFGNEQFTISPKMDKQELHYAVDFLNVSINGFWRYNGFNNRKR